MSKPKVIIVSGYFNPIHKGHLEYFNNAKSMADKLFVIVNNDNQAKLKKGNSFMNELDRMKIVSSLKCVDEVFLSIDKDKTQCKSLEHLKPHIFHPKCLPQFEFLLVPLLGISFPYFYEV